jgi:hypothetical protein
MFAGGKLTASNRQLASRRVDLFTRALRTCLIFAQSSGQSTAIYMHFITEQHVARFTLVESST